MAHQSTTPWSALDSDKEAKIHARGIPVVPWFVSPTESSSTRVLYRGEVAVPPREDMASMQGSAT